jgi:diguanylate cyclase (GGDEF)-like protein
MGRAAIPMTTLASARSTRETQPVTPREPVPTLVDELASSPAVAPDLAKDRCLFSVVCGPRHDALLPMVGRELTVGRGPNVDEGLDDPFVSRRHARFFWNGSTLYVEDLGSTNGTWVGKRRVVSPHRVRDGSYVRLGRDVLLRCGLYDRVSEQSLLGLYASSRQDPLTHCYNRRYFDEQLEAEVSFARRSDGMLSLMLIDIDEFKRINDSRGHESGDAALRVVTQCMRRLLRPEDVLCRYGGDEFALIARGIAERNAVILAERVRRAVAGLDRGGGQKLSISIGVASRRPKSCASRAVLFSMADRSLYRAKAEGRNRVCVTAV